MKYLHMRFPEAKLKAATLSFDDGVKQDIRFSQTLNKYGIKCTFNINSGKFGEANRLTPAEIKEHILDKGHEVALHGEHHKANGLVSPVEGIKDVLNCRLALEKEFDIFIRGMAYPDSGIRRFQNGTTYETVKNYLTDLGVLYARTLGGDNNSFEVPTDWHAWMPSAHWLHDCCDGYIDEFLSIGNSGYSSGLFPRLLYIWGHAYECDRNGDKWGVLEEMCKKLGGKEDIWYATNIEICEYVKAFNSLVFNAEGTKVYNPTLKTIWFYADGTDYKIASGETVRID